MTTTNQNPPIVILGCHRSGTSLLAQVMQSMGMNIGDEKNNHAEDMFFLRINEEIFRICHASWDRPMAVAECLRDGSTLDHITDYIVHKYPVTLDAKTRLTGKWGWKDPRTVFTLPIWVRIFPELRVIGIVRHGLDVTASLVSREMGRATAYNNPVQSIRCQAPRCALAVWREYTQTVMDVIRQRDGKCIRFEDMVSDPQTISDIGAWAGLKKKTSLRLDPSRAFAYRRLPQDADLKAAAACEPLFSRLNYTI